MWSNTFWSLSSEYFKTTPRVSNVFEYFPVRRPGMQEAPWWSTHSEVIMVLPSHGCSIGQTWTKAATCRAPCTTLTSSLWLVGLAQWLNEPVIKMNELFHDMALRLGTLFLWMFWPSFNSAITDHGDGQHRAAINTYLALASTVLTTVAISSLFQKHGKLDMVPIQSDTPCLSCWGKGWICLLLFIFLRSTFRIPPLPVVLRWGLQLSSCWCPTDLWS